MSLFRNTPTEWENDAETPTTEIDHSSVDDVLSITPVKIILKKTNPFRMELLKKLSSNRISEAERLQTEKSIQRPVIPKLKPDQKALVIIRRYDLLLRKDAVRGLTNKQRYVYRRRRGNNSHPILWFHRWPPSMNRADLFPFHHSKHKINKESSYSKAVCKQYPTYESDQRDLLKAKKKPIQTMRSQKYEYLLNWNTNSDNTKCSERGTRRRR